MKQLKIYQTHRRQVRHQLYNYVYAHWESRRKQEEGRECVRTLSAKTHSRFHRGFLNKCAPLASHLIPWSL